MIPLALATIIFNLAPFWTSILGYFVLGDPIYKIEFVAMAICLALVIYMTVMK
jgi:drug/metabolite transporter (DMT)-like permease